MNFVVVISGICGIFMIIGGDGASLEKQIYDAAPNAHMFDMFHIMPEGDVNVMTELDLLLTLDQFRALYHTNPNRRKRKAFRDVSRRWPGCKVYYEITDSIKEDKRVIAEAIAEWEKYTCLSFYETKYIRNRIQFQDGGGCYSKLGMQDKPQPLVLAPGCRFKGIVAHEIGHAIGWLHEHMRPDRDDFIQINFEVIPERYKANFRKYTSEVVNTYGVRYDYHSLMHYGADAVPNSIVTLDPNYQSKIGQRHGLTFKDIKLANLMYECAKNMHCKSKSCPHDGFVLYKNYKGEGTCQCWCDSGDVTDPLVLCDSIEKPLPPPEPILPKKKIIVTKECRDVREDCGDLAGRGFCMSKMEMMKDICPKTCDFCGKGSSLCMDSDKGCPLMVASGACEDEGLKLIMQEICKKSCNLCPGEPPSPCDVQYELMGYSRSSSPHRPTAECLWLFGLLTVLIACDKFGMMTFILSLRSSSS